MGATAPATVRLDRSGPVWLVQLDNAAIDLPLNASLVSRS